MAHLSLADLSRMPKMAEKPKKWVTKAVKPENRGKFREKAQRAGETTAAFAKKHESSSGTLGKEARLAETLMGLPHKSKRRSMMYDHARSRKD